MMLLTPRDVVAEIAEALPAECRSSVIIIGSLAAGCHFFTEEDGHSVRTKDADCMFSPHAKAVAAAEQVTAQLLEADWIPRPDERWGTPGDAATPEDKLPMIRLKPPGTRSGSDWFLELLGAPEDAGDSSKRYHRVRTRLGDYAICSFRYLALAEWRPLETHYGLRLARPEMMALANMLHHPTVDSKLIEGSDIKRSNKDLGRVLALAWLAAQKDRRDGTDAYEHWADNMLQALQERFPGHAHALAAQAGSGVRELMGSAADLNQALGTCNRGLLAMMEVRPDAFVATGRRFLQTVVEPLEDFGRQQA